eukprot:CAMPEP_0181338368 /NCGR_PEP_ID=MMETSP1101-20121128/28598_1 /TAXON_ID=46948 /ORGANISM="Rhodomonas abbreviata, Strain Caron Lab Isolate" /LENGTH=535 /DNA_ID=CAMNT_0023449091 /DNA_START=165 /DNA_END=1772 /DNA_ORIENTATION=-
MSDGYEDAENFLETIADDVPLFTNTREGVYSDGARMAPAPLEAPSDLFVSPMRAQMRQYRAASKPSQPASNSQDSTAAIRLERETSNGVGRVANARAAFESMGGSFKSSFTSSTKSLTQEMKSLDEEQAEQALTIDGLQMEIADLQADALDSDEDDGDTPADGGVSSEEGTDKKEKAPEAGKEEAVKEAGGKEEVHRKPSDESRSSRSGKKGAEKGKDGQTPAPNEKNDNLPEKMMSELAFSGTDSKEVSPAVIQGLVQIMRESRQEKRKKATIAMCNLCCESSVNRANAGAAGAVPVLIEMMQDSNPDLQIQRLATACICNLSADPPLKDAIAQGGAIPHLSKLLDTNEDSVDARAATAHAAATLWSLCVDMEHIKPMVAQPHTLKALLKQLRSPESFVRGQACGCVGEVCIGNKKIKGQLSELGVIPALMELLDETEPATQRLAASALCNLSANHDENKKLSRQAGLLDALVRLLKATSDEAVQSAAAGGLYNLVSSADREKLQSLGVIDLLQKVPISRNINVRLGIKDKKEK